MATHQSFRDWKYYSFELRYRGKKRLIDVYADAPASAAIFATGRIDDEEVVSKRVDPLDEKFRSFWTPKRPNMKEISEFWAGMADAYRIEVDFSGALSLVAPNAITPVFRGVIAGLYHNRLSTKDLAELFSLYPIAFDKVAVTVIRRGAETGKLADAFAQLAEESTEQLDIMSEVYAALWYPGFLALTTSVALTVVNTVALPQVLKTFDSMHFQLPLIMRILIFLVRDILSNPFVMVFPPLFLIFSWRRRKEWMQWRWVQELILRIPLVGHYYRKMILARSLKTLSLFYAASIPQKQGYEIASEMCGNFRFAEYFAAVSSHLSKGVRLYLAFQMERDRIGKEGLAIANKMRLAGETANEDAVLSRVAQAYKKDVQRMSRTMPKLVEPCIILVVGGVIGLTFIAMFASNLAFSYDSIKDATKMTHVVATPPVDAGK